MKKGGEEEEEEVWLSQKTRTTVLAVNDCSWWIITHVLSLYHQLHSGLIQRKTLKHDELLCRIRFLILCVVFLVPWMNTLPGENMLPLLCKSMGPYVGLPEKVKLNHLAKTLKSISRKSYIWACLKIGNTPKFQCNVIIFRWMAIWRVCPKFSDTHIPENLFLRRAPLLRASPTNDIWSCKTDLEK